MVERVRLAQVKDTTDRKLTRRHTDEYRGVFAPTTPPSVETNAIAMVRCESALRDRVVNVLGLRGEEEMIRIRAARIVATMRDDLAFRDGTVGECPREAIGCPDFAVRSNLRIAMTRQQVAEDIPATVWLANDSRFEKFSGGIMLTSPAAQANLWRTLLLSRAVTQSHHGLG